MILPASVSRCIRALEDAGFAAYAVGGCVRDDRMGITPHDYDLCTSALPEQTSAVFAARSQVLAGVKHGTVGIVTEDGVIEITTFRREGTYADNRHPDWVEFVPEIEADLARRDFTVNAMAWSPTRGYADPFGGLDDLKAGVLRAVGDPYARFREDSLRILRGMRFAVRFGFRLEEKTEAAMLELAALTDNLARERVFSELCGFLPLATDREILHWAPILTRIIPELAPMVGFDQRSPHHAYDIYTHTAHVFQAVPGTLPLRWAALLHDIGKVPTFTTDENGRGHFYGHAQVGAEMADGILRRLHAPNDLREYVLWLISHHMTRLTPDKKQLRRALSRYGSSRVHDLLALQEADMGSKGTGEHEGRDLFPKIRTMLAELEAEETIPTLKDLAINGNDLITLGLTGAGIGKMLNHLLEKVLDESLANERDALLDEVRRTM